MNKKLLITLVGMFFLHAKVLANDIASVEKWTGFSDLIVKGRFVFEKEGLPDNDQSKYSEYFDLKFSITEELKGSLEKPVILIPVLRYVLPNDSATLSRGAEANAILERAIKKFRLLQEKVAVLSKKLEVGEITEGEYKQESNAIWDQADALTLTGKLFFENPFSNTDFFIGRDKEYILFLRRVDKDGEKSYQLLGHGGAIFEDVAIVEKVVREFGSAPK